MTTYTTATLASRAFSLTPTRVLAACLAISLAACAPQSAPPPQEQAKIEPAPKISADKVQVMVLGTYHFDNPGQDLANVEADDVLTPTRQAELAKVVDALAAYKPTIIMVERVMTAPAYIDTHYTDFTKADLATKRDERVQIAYRLAHQLGHEKVYGIDEQPSDGEPDYFPFGKLMEHAQTTGQGDALNGSIAKIQAKIKAFSDTQKHKTITELLIASNGNDLTNAGFYYSMFEYDRGEAQPGAELQSYWFMRNAKIFGKAHQLAKPGDRVLIVYGGGHKFWLNHFAENTPGYVSVDPVTFLQKTKTK